MRAHNKNTSFSNYQLPLIRMNIGSFYSVNLDLMSNIHKYQCGYELFAALCIVGGSELTGIYADSTPC